MLNPQRLLLFAILLSFIGGINCSRLEATYSSDPDILAKGNRLFDNYCVACHNFRTTGIGPNLAGITHEVSEEWLKEFVQNPMQVIQAGDARGQKLFEQFKQYMPPFEMLSEEDLDAILAYVHTHKPRPETPTRTEWGELVMNPVVEPIAPSGVTLILQEFAQAPATAAEGQQARINKIAPTPDNSRLYVHDLRGKMYELREGKTQLFLDLASQMEHFIHVPGHGTGMGSFAFHPEYAQNGLLYTTHTEAPTGTQADFALPEGLRIKLQWVFTEWKQDDPASHTFGGTHREILRVDMVSQIHGVQAISFNPLAQKGGEDYGLLYIGIGDGGSVGGRKAFLVQNKAHVWGCILRIDPLGNNSHNGKYGIPTGNPFVGETGSAGEIYAYGFRNPHRFTWDPINGGALLSSDIGQHFMEEVNIVVPGANYGWPDREGTYRVDKEGDLGKLYPLPTDDSTLGYTYPVAQFDHDEGLAICGGYLYQGAAAPELQGHYVFGEIVQGRLFSVDASALKLGTQAPIHSIALELENGEPAEWPELTDNVRTGHTRVDFRMGLDADGELYLSTKANGKIFKVVGSRSDAMTSIP